MRAGQVLWIAPAVLTMLLPGALPARQGAAPPWKRTLDARDAQRVAEREKRSEQLEKAGRLAEAQTATREIVAIRTRAQGADHWQTFDAGRRVDHLRRLAGLSAQERAQLAAAGQTFAEATRLRKANRHAEAEALYRKVLEVRTRLLGEDCPDTVLVCYNLAYVLGEQGRYAQGETFVRKALAVQSRALPAEHPEIGASHSSLAKSLSDQGKHAEAEGHYRKSLEVRLRVLGENHERTALSYNNLATNLDDLGRFAEAASFFEKCLGICRRLFGEDDPITAINYSNTGTNRFMQGKYAEAELFYQKALAIRRRTLGENDLQTGESYNNIAANLNSQGKVAEAEQFYKKALAIRRQVQGEKHRDTADGYNNLAFCLQEQRRHAEAELLFDKALELRRGFLGEDHPETAISYSNLAANLDLQGKHDRARKLHETALAIHRRRLGEEHADTARSLSNLGVHLEMRGQHAEAAGCYQKALQARQRVLGEDHPDTAASCSMVLGNHRKQGRYAAAEQVGGRAVRSFEAARLRIGFAGLQRVDFARKQSPLPQLAAVLARRGQAEGAWRQLESNLARGLLDEVARPGTEAERAQQHQLLWKLHNLDERITRLLGPGDAGGPSPERLAQARPLQAERDQVQKQVAGLQAELVKQYGVAGGAVYDLKRIQSHLPARAALVAWVDLDDAPGAADLAGDHWACIVRRSGVPVWVKLEGSGPGGSWTREDSTLAEQVREGLRQRPRDALGAWQDGTARLAEQRLAPLADALRGVTHLIVLPSPALAGIPVETLTERHSVHYAPSGTIFAYLAEKPAVPGQRLLAVGAPVLPAPAAPAALPDPPDHGVLLAMVVHGLNAERSGLQRGDVLLRYAGQRLKGPADVAAALARVAAGTRQVPVEVWRAGRTLALSVAPGKLGVVFSPGPAAEAIRSQREGDRLVQRSQQDDSFRELPYAQWEVDTIAGLFSRPEVLLRAAASEAKLEELVRAGRLPEFRYVHLATHAKAGPFGGLQSYLVLSRGSLPDPVERLLAAREVHSGKLTAEQVLRTWRLDAELVTLSACETGLGQQGGGEGYLGFAQALFLAGARSLVLSQWKVDDQATALLMARFYQNLLGRRPGLDQPLSKAAALSEAKRWLRTLDAAEVERLQAKLPAGQRGEESALPATLEAAQPYRHPYYWASFILVGDPGEVDQAAPVLASASEAPADPGRTWLWAVGAGGLLAAGGLAWLLRRGRSRR